MSVWLNAASAKWEGMEEMERMCANLQRENMFFSENHLGFVFF